MTTTVFTRARWAVGLAIMLAAGAMVRYPGGTGLDPSSTGYSLQRNFLSDLGMTVAYDGRSNRLGALCFVLSLGTLVVAMGGCLIGFLRFYALEPRARRLARAASAVGFVVCAAFGAVAITPENHVMTLHIGVTLLAWRAFPVLSLLLAFASRYSTVVSPRVAVAWAALTVALTGYVIILSWGPALDTDAGLRVQVVAQKGITAVVLAIFLYLSVEGNRAAARVPNR